MIRMMGLLPKYLCIISLALILMVQLLATGASGQQCGSQGGGKTCAGGLCCSQFGWCGSTPAYCGPGCQSQCHGKTTTTATATATDHDHHVITTTLLTPQIFDQMLKYRNHDACPAKGFYTYDAFIRAATSFQGFATTGDLDTRKREIAAFFAQTSHQTKGGYEGAPDGPYAWGYCFVRSNNPRTYCSSKEWPCLTGRQYYGRGPMQLSHNHNYGLASEAIGANLLQDPELAATNPEVSFKTAIWYWMNPQGEKPSSHDVITGQWRPSDTDKSANRIPGYGAVTNVISGDLECGHGPDDRVASRIGFYKRYCDMLGVTYGDNLDCADQTPFP